MKNLVHRYVGQIHSITEHGYIVRFAKNIDHYKFKWPVCKNDLSESEESEIEYYNIYSSKKRKRMFIPTESESEIDDVEKFVNENIDRLSASTSQKWLQPKGHQPSVIAFTEPTGIIYSFIVCFVFCLFYFRQ